MNSSLSNSSSETVEEKPAWERSVGLLSSKKCLPMLVKKKTKSLEQKTKVETFIKPAKQTLTSQGGISLLQQNVDVKNIPLPSKIQKLDTDNSKIISLKSLSNSTSGLGLLGAYSDSDSD